MVLDEFLNACFNYRIEELAVNTGGFRRVLRVLVARAVFSRCIAFGGLFAHKLVEYLLSSLIIHGCLRLRAGGERGAATAIRKVNHVAAAFGLNAGLIHLVG